MPVVDGEMLQALDAMLTRAADGSGLAIPGACTPFDDGYMVTFVILDYYDPAYYHTVQGKYTMFAGIIGYRVGVDAVYCEVDGIGCMVLASHQGEGVSYDTSGGKR